MELHLTLASAPPSAFPVREIVVDTSVLGTGAALRDRLEAAGYRGSFTVGGIPLATLLPHDGHLHDGAIVVVGGAGAPEEHARVPPLVLVVHSGPDAGQVFPLTRGTYTIGRAGDIVVSDPALSRHHARLTVTEEAILLEDLDSGNGTFVDGRTIRRAVITVAATIRVGASHCRIHLLDDRSREAVPSRATPEPSVVDTEAPRKPSRLVILTVLLPLVLGLVLALTTGMWFFLAFSALSAVTGLVPLLTYRRAARTFAHAVDRAAEQDRVRRVQAVPDPGRIALDALRDDRGTTPRPRRDAAPPEVVLLRLGTADQPADLTVRRHEGPFPLPILPDLPLVLACHAGTEGAGGRFTLTGEAGAVQGLVRALLLQVAAPHAGAPSVICWGSARDLPLQARFLPNVRLTRDSRILASLVGRAPVTLVLQFTDDLPELGAAKGLHVIRIITGHRGSPGTGPGSTAPGAGIALPAGAAARARLSGRDFEVVPDGVSGRTFDRTVRLLAGAAAREAVPVPSGSPDARASGRDVPPRSASLWSAGLAPETLATTAPARWASSDPGRPTARLGESGTGPVSIDLVGDGPHLLVAGTTGSGKSELLRTLVLGLAMDQPPDHLSLLLIDYKGGSGLGALAALPHCVGSLDDLSTESTGRALVSLRAELRRREQLCAERGVQDLVELRRVARSACPPRLVVVIDEFRMLSDEVPSAVPDLMRIAALGRSLGVHLVLSTQRPQGAVTPEMRANITSSVLLRVQTALESQDLLGSAEAAAIPVDIPGRAFLRRGAGTPVAFQVASCSELPSSGAGPGWQDIASYLGDAAPDPPGDRSGPRMPAEAPGPCPLPPMTTDPIALRADADGRPAQAAGTTTGDGGSACRPAARDTLRAAAAALTSAAGGPAAQRLQRPVLPPLAAVLTRTACSGIPPADPEFPGPSTGAPAPAGTVLLGIADRPEFQEQHLLQWRPQHHSHLALIGLSCSGGREALASAMSALPTADPDVHLYLLDGDASLTDVPHGPHVGAYVPSAETKRAARVLERLAALPAGTAGSTSIVLAITGWGRWAGLFRDRRSSRAEEDLHGLIRDGAHSGVSVVITGDRDLTTARFFPLVPNRIYLPRGAHPETTMTWPAMPPVDAVPGRGLAQGPITGSRGDAVCQLVLETLPDRRTVRPPARPPFPVHPLPRSVPLARLAPAPVAGTRDALTLGVHGDDLLPYRVPLRPGETYPVLGHPASGRSNALRVLAESARGLPWWTVILPPRQVGPSELPAFWHGLPDRTDIRGVLDRCILIIDDADELPADVQHLLAGFVARGAAAVLAVVPGPALVTRVPLTLHGRSSGRGLVLSPRSTADGDLFGTRLDVEGAAVPGRGYACDPGGVLEIQVARASEDRDRR